MRYVQNYGLVLCFKYAAGLAALLLTAAGVAQLPPSAAMDHGGHTANQAGNTLLHTFLGPWRVIGPIDTGLGDQKERMEKAYLDLETGKALPESVTTGGLTLSSVSVPPGIVNLGLAFDRSEEFKNTVAYAETSIRSEKEQTVLLTLGGDDGVIAWLNGEKVLDNVRPNGVYLDDKIATVTLRSGINHLLVKCDNISEDWGFVARLLPVEQPYTVRFLYHLKPLPVNIANLPTAQLEFIDASGKVLDKQLVSAWKFRGSPTRAAYIAYPHVTDQPAKVRVTMPVPGTERTYTRTYTWEDATDQSIGEQANLKLQGQVVDAITSNPIGNATLSFTNMATSQVVTADDGTFITTHVDAAYGRIYVNAEGHLETIAQVDLRSQDPVTIELQPGGVELAGTIRDEDNNPIKGAIIRFHAGGRQRQATSDNSGRYSVSGIKATSIAGMTVYPTISHPDFQPLGTFSEKIGGKGTTTKDFILKKGLFVTGKVTDPSGKPIANVRIASGEDDFASNSANPETHTDDKGNFRLGGLKSGNVNIFAIHDDWAPAMEKLTLAGAAETSLNFALQPGEPVRGRIVDSEGKGLEGAWVATDTWRGARMFIRRATAGPDGKFEILHMPAEPVEGDFLMQGYASVRNVQLQAGDENVSVTLPRPARVSGVVVDAQSGQPLKAFNLIKGIEWKNSSSSPHWQDAEKLSPADGKFAFTDDELSNYNRLLRIEADGYKTWQYPQSIAIGQQVSGIEARLEKASLHPATIFTPEGQPAAGAKIHLFGTDRTLWLGKSASQSKAKVFTADSSGIAQLPDDISQEDGLFVEKEGIGAILLESVDAKADPFNISLEPFGKITGAVYEGEEPVKNQDMVLIRGSSRKLQVHYDARTDGFGRFTFENIPAGEYSLAVARTSGNSTSYDRQQKIMVSPGENKPYIIGGQGGTLVYGKVTKEGGTPLPGISIRLYNAGGQSFTADTDATGAYEITELPAGEMTLSAQSPYSRSSDSEQFYASEKVTVPVTEKFEKNMELVARKALAAGSVLKDLDGVDASGTTTTLADQKQKEIFLILTSSLEKTQYKELLTSVTEKAKGLPETDFAVIAVLYGGDNDESLQEFSSEFPRIKFISPSPSWISEFYKRHSMARDIVGVIAEPGGKVKHVIKQLEELKQLKGEGK